MRRQYDMNIINRLNPLAVMAVLTLPVLWGVSMVMPVFDDWWYLTTPGDGMAFTVESLLPQNQYWRPFDALFGILLGKWPWLFPELNHLCVVAAHVGCTVLVYRFMRTMALSRQALWTGTLFFYMSPAVLGTLLNCDSLNQTYSALFGLLSVYVFITAGSRHRHWLYAVMVLIAALWKENGLAWAAATPLFAWMISPESRREIRRSIAWCVVICIVYFAARASLQVGEIVSQDFIEGRKGSYLKYIATWLSYSLLPADYISLMFRPERNWLYIVLTVALSVPFLGVLLWGSRRSIADRRFFIIVACACITALPHLVTVFGNMHCYASLPFVALAVAWLADRNDSKRTLGLLFTLYLVACAFTGFRHWQMAWRSGMKGQELAGEILKQSHGPARNVLLLYDDTPQPGFSTFCTPPIESFGYGEAVRMATGYAWPDNVTGLPMTNGTPADSTVQKALGNGYDAVWELCDGKARVLGERQ